MDDDRTAALAGGVAMPVVGLGTWQLSGRSGYEAVRLALELGYRHIDTATIYRNETDVGRALRDSGVPRSEVFLTTKLPDGRTGAERRTLDSSLHALDTGYVDLWLIHWPPNGDASPRTWEQLIAAQQDGQAKAIGVSNYSLDQIDELTATTGHTPAVNQISWNPRRHDAAEVAGHRERSVVLEGYSPFKRTNLRDRTLAAVATAHGVTPAQVVLRWHLEHGIVVIPKSATPERLAANLDVFGFALTPDEVARIDALGGR